MVEMMSKKLTRDDWLRSALEMMRKIGMEGVKVSRLASQMGITGISARCRKRN